MQEQITFDEFAAKTVEEQSIYIQERLHLSYYRELDPDCPPDAAAQGNRLIGFVMIYRNAVGQPHYYIHPIDCLNADQEFQRGILFQNSRDGFPLLKDDALSRNAVEKACATVTTGRGERMVCGKYVLRGRKPILLTSVRVLDVSPEEMQERIRGICYHRIALAELGKQQELLEQVKASVQEEQANLEQLQQRRKEEAGQLERARNAANALTRKVQELAGSMQALGFELNTQALELEAPSADGAQPASRKESIADLSGLARQTRSTLAQTYGLYYQEHVVREFLGAMFSNQILILSGPPGTGKSSLPPAIAKCIGAECRMVSVQPSWTDNQDLLGFYDPTHERFAATPFLEILVDASREPDTIYLVCLDEMNLVRVEYYFSEILSAMETARRQLRLYSPFAYAQRDKALTRQISPLLKKVSLPGGEEERRQAAEKLEALLEKLELLHRYKATFQLPPNVQFIGTLNMDESTRELSPKVLDRSFIIEVGKAEEPFGEAERELLPEDIYAPSAFQNMQGCLSPPELEEQMRLLEELLARIEALGDEARPVKAALSRRGQAQVRKLLCRGLDLDDIFLGKVLPAMQYTGLELDELTQQLDEYRPLLEKSLDKLTRMYDRELQELNYWG